MPKNRRLLLFAATVALMSFMSAYAMAGGPAAGQAGTSERSAFPFGGSGAGAGSGTPTGGFSLGGGVGSANIVGSNGPSDALTLSDVGINDTFIWNLRAMYETSLMGLFFRLGGDFYNAKYSGSVGSYSGHAHPVLAVGQGAEGKLDTTMWFINLDFDLASAFLQNGRMMIGPRIQYANYYDNFQVTNTTTNNSSNTSRNEGMFGIGFAGGIDLGKISGFVYKDTWGTLSPGIFFAATFGKGGNMRYDTYEVMARLYQSNTNNFVAMNMSPTLYAEFGVQGFRFKETRDDTDNVVVWWGHNSNADYRVTALMARLMVGF